MKPEYTYIHLSETESTNKYLRENAHLYSGLTVVDTVYQSAGRGQRGNSWESESGCNITMSMLIYPSDIEAIRQFEISEAVALGIVDTLRPLLPCHEVCIKWPNDIYVGDQKICGILIENSIVGRYIKHSIAGIGININQQRFISDAPNPVSIIQLTGKETDTASVRHDVISRINARMAQPPQLRHQDYMQCLWRKDACKYLDTHTGETFTASIHDVEPDGILVLQPHPDNISKRRYYFKEVSAIIPQ